MFKLLSCPAHIKSLKKAVKRNTCFVLKTQADVLPFLQQCRSEFQGQVLFCHDVDDFHSQLKTCLVDKQFQKGYKIVDGPHAALFGEKEVVLVIDYTQIPKERLSSLNELFDKPPRFLGKILGPKVKIVSVLTEALAKSGLKPDCYSRLTYTKNRANKTPILSIPPLKKMEDIPADAVVVEFHHADSWRDILFGKPTLGKEGGLIFEPSNWIESLNKFPQSQTVVLKNAPLQDKGFQDFLAQMSRGLREITVNGKPCFLPDSLQVVTYEGYTKEESLFLHTHLVSEEEYHLNKDNFGLEVLVNSATFDRCFSCVYPDDKTGELIQTKGIIDFLSFHEGGLIKIRGPVSDDNMQKLRFKIAEHNQQHPTKKIAIQQVKEPCGYLDKDQAPEIITGSDLRMIVKAIKESEPNSVVIDIGLITKPEDLTQHWNILSFQKQQYEVLDSQIKEALDAGRTLILRGLDSSEECLRHLETLFEEPPYLWAEGQKHIYQGAQIKAVFQTIPPLLEAKASISFNHDVADYKVYFKRDTELFDKLQVLDKALAPFLKKIGYVSFITLSFLETLFEVEREKGMSEALHQVIATRFRSYKPEYEKVIALIENVFPSEAQARVLVSEKVHIVTEAGKNMAALMKAVRRFPLTVVEGDPGSGKTYLAEQVGLQLNGNRADAPVWNISVGPDADPDMLIGKSERVGDKLVFKEGPLVKWARYRSTDPDVYPTLVINEANFPAKGFWNCLNGLKESPPFLDTGTEKIWLTPNHRVILTQNDLSLEGRVLHPELAALAYPLYFATDEPNVLFNALVKPLLLKRGITEKSQQIEAIDKIRSRISIPLSIRECLDVTEVVAAEYRPVTQGFGQIKAKLRKLDPHFDFDNGSTEQLIFHAWNRLELAHQTPGFKGKRGMLVIGPPARGKDAVIDRVVSLHAQLHQYSESEQVRRITCKVRSDYFEMADVIAEAKAKGQKLLISEHSHPISV